jgi:methyl-accepting chemotaxis protein
MNDQLQYEIYLSLSEKGVQEVTAQIEQLQKAFDEGVKRAGGMSTAVDEFGRLVDITGKATNAAKANITTQGALQKAIEEKRKALTEVNKAIRSSSEVSDEDAQKKPV